MRSYLGFMLVAFVVLAMGSLAGGSDGDGAPWGASARSEPEMPPPALPRWREGGTPYNADQPLHPYAVSLAGLRDAPSGVIDSPPEYSPTRGVIFWYASSQWPDVVTDLVVALTADPAHDEIAYVVVTSAGQQTSAINYFTAGGADMSKVQFIQEPGNALWIRDYGPHFIWHNGALAIVDSQYYPTRSLDNFVPTLLGDDHFIMPTYDMGLYYSGGNFQPGPGRSGFVTALINMDNPSSGGFSAELIAELYQQYQGIDTLHVMPQLPSWVDGTGHIDMWMYLVDEDSVIISRFKSGSDATAIQITDNAVPYMQALGFEVFRPWAWNSGGVHYTYTNAFRVNDRIFVPVYPADPGEEDAHAIAQWVRAAGTGVEIIPIDSYSIIPAAGAIHCIVMQVPRCLDPTPAVHVVWPDGGQLLVSGTTQTIQWAATDTNNVTIPQIDLYYSSDDGETYAHIATTTDIGAYLWTVPDVATTQARIKVVATSSDSDQGEAVSENVFQIAAAEQTVYDFSTGAGVDRFALGHQTIAWNSDVSADRTPVTSEIDALVGGAYGRIADSDAAGGDGDSNRYIAPNPSDGRESTHTFEFTIAEDPAEIDDIEIRWEGYADQCAQVELYVWDYVAGQWSDGGGLTGQNRYMDNWAGNEDGLLEGHIGSDFDRYINASGQMTLLVYAERPTAFFGSWFYLPTFHDYVVVTVSTLNQLAGDYDGDGDVDGGDYAFWPGCMTGPDAGPYDPGCEAFDFEADNDVDLADFKAFSLVFAP